ncbi:ABC transporter permease [Streptosporangium sp. NPDC049644]|uniref:ABC transporter permease n=1 Tax=Streptosporangium sp. NPDC049644 TaxID=3155507 RepID=UPI003420F621
MTERSALSGTSQASPSPGGGREGAARVPGGRRKRRVPETIGLLIFLAVEVVFFSVQSPYFFNWDNWGNILTAVSITGVLAAAGTLLLVAGQFDLSVGSGVAFVGIVLVETAPSLGLGPALVLSVLAGVGIGLLNGFLVTVVGVNALITTLGMLGIFRGLTLVIGKGQSIFIEGFDWATARPFLGIPMPAIVLVVVIALFYVLMHYTVFGRKMYAIGANPVAARLVGIRVNRTIFAGFLLSGGCMALAGLLVTSQLGSSSANTGVGLELAVVTAVILGGTSLSGGTGTIFGTVVGLLIVGVLSNGLTLLNVDSSWQQVATGVLLILAVAVDRLRQTYLRKAG